MGGRIRILFTGSAPLPAWAGTFYEAAGLPLLEGYAMSENSVPLALNRLGAARVGSVGRVLAPNEIRLAEDGEILVRGPGVIDRYWGSEPARPLFTTDGFFQTGDLGRFDADGYLFLSGRKDGMIKLSTGRKMSPERVETVYGASPLSDRVLVVGQGRPAPVALLWLKTRGNGATPPKERIAEELARRGKALEPHERVRQFLVVSKDLDISQGTLTASLKPRRKIIETLYRSAIERDSVPVPNHTKEDTMAKDLTVFPNSAASPLGVSGFVGGSDETAREGRELAPRSRGGRGFWKRLLTRARLFLTVRVVEGLFLRRLSREFYLLIGGHIHFQALSAAVRFDLFTLLDDRGDLTETDIAAELHIEPQPARILLLSLAAAKLLKKHGERYRNSWVARRYLSQRSRTNITKIILWQHFINYRAMYHFFDSLKLNQNIGLQLFKGKETTLYERLAHAPDLEMVFQDAMGQISGQANDLFARFADLRNVKSLLDVGGGNGSNILRLAARHPRLQAGVFDSPTVCALARDNIRRHGFAHRLTAHEGDGFTTPFPAGYDAILFCHFFTIWSKERNLELLKKAQAYLPAGGRVMIFNMMQRNDRRGPLSAAMGSPYFLTLATGEGMLYTWEEYEDLFRQAGFIKVRRVALPRDHGIIEGVRE
ncbi:MAG: AMP-binding protein [Elusimicrobia bacterium]|nr:AMP-binding protein [Elusimicrobiota bacterium]